MFSVVNVADYGARPNDGVNDLSAIKAALNASKAGDTILFDGGVFDLSGFASTDGNGLLVPSDRTYKGQNGATLRGRDTKGPQIHVRVDNVTLTGLTFDGGGVMVDRSSGRNTNIVIDKNVFKINTSGDNKNGITFTSGLNNSRISNNYFTGYASAFAIYGYNYNGLTIANNEIVDVTGGMHIDAFANSGNLLVEQNYLSGIRGMGLEFQSQGSGTGPHTTNLVFQDNFYEKPKLSSVFSENWNTFAYSLIVDKSENVSIRRNTVLAPERPDGTGVRIGFEVGGDNTVIEDNYVNGINHVLASNDGAGTSSLLVRNNRFMNYLQGIGGINLGAVRLEGTNNSSTKLTWDTNRAKPGIGDKRYGAVTTPVPDPIPQQTPQPDPVDQLPDVPAERDVSVYLSDLNWNVIKNGWGGAERDQSNGEKNTGDGRRITLNGRTYEKGIGVHASSEIRYDLDGKYATFSSDIGIDDEVGSGGSAVFQVFGDGVKLYDSGKMTGSSATKNVTLGVVGVQELTLVVTNGGDNTNYDHADWADAKLVAATPVVVAPPAADDVALSALNPSTQVNGWGQFERNRSNGENGAGDGRTMTMNGVKYANGLGVHANSTLAYSLNGKYQIFVADIGVDDEVGDKGSVIFEVWADGERIYQSSVMTGSSATKSINLDVTGKNQLMLVVGGAGGVDYDHANWANANLYV